MAGRVAAARQGWADAIRYFTNLTSNPNCPVDLRVQALFAYGDTLMSLPDPANTNRAGNYREAIRIFQNLCQSYPSNKLTVLAWGEMANCYLQWVQNSRQSELDTNVFFDFQQVISSPLADAAARSIAKVGLAAALEKQAELKTGAERDNLLKQALDNYLDVFHEKILREGEKSDLFWMKKAGWEAGRLAEALQRWQVAKSIYEQLRELLPPLRARLDKNILRVQEHVQTTAGP